MGSIPVGVTSKMSRAICSFFFVGDPDGTEESMRVRPTPQAAHEAASRRSIPEGNDVYLTIIGKMSRAICSFFCW